MAATHHLDVSLALDDIGWYFLNFGEPNLVRETECGLRELGLLDLATWFAEALQIVRPFLQVFDEGRFSGELEPGKSRGDIYYEWLDETGMERGLTISRNLPGRKIGPVSGRKKA